MSWKCLSWLALAVAAAAAIEPTPPYFTRLQTEEVVSSPFVRWTDFGPGMAGYSDKFFVHPTDPYTMHVTMDMGNAYYTHDNGLSWATTKDWDTNAEGMGVGCIDFSRQSPDFGLAVGDHGVLMVTHDRGSTFKSMNQSAWGTKQVGVIAVDPNNDNNWYVGSGQFWRVKEVHRSASNLTGTHVQNTDYGHIFVSKNKGVSWKTIPLDPLLDVAKIFIDPGNSSVVYAVTNTGFLKSTNGGFEWTKTGTGLPYNQPRDGDFFYDNDSKEFILYLLEQTHYEADQSNSKTIRASGGLFKSTDRGDTWVPINGNIAVDMTQIHQDLATSAYYKTIGYWFGISPSQAQNKFPDFPQSTFTVFNRVVASRTIKGTLYLSNNLKHDFSFGPGEIWKSSDDGQTWIAVARNGIYWVNETDKAYWQSRRNPLGMNMKYAHLDFEMRTTDMDAGVRMLVSKSDGDLIAIHEQQTLRSIDHGESWVQCDDDEVTPGSGKWVGRGGSNLPGITMLMETGRPEYLFASGEHGLWRIASGGESVLEHGVAVEQITGESKGVYGATSICSIAVHPTNPDIMYIQMFRQSFRGEIRKSTDGGKTWTNISYPIQSSSDLSANIIRQKDFTISKMNPSIMYFTVPYTDYCPFTPTQFIRNGPSDFNAFGIYRSKDGGVTWEWLNHAGLPTNGSVARLTMHPNNSLQIYAALNRVNVDGESKTNGGLFVTNDGGDTWQRESIPSEILGVNHVSINQFDGTIYLSAGEFMGDPDGGGVWRRSPDGNKWDKIFYMPNVFECYVSPANSNVIVVSVGMGKKIGSINPGVFFSKDSGRSWTKANYNFGQPSRIMAIRPDLVDDNIIWAALYGSGWVKGTMSNTMVRAVAGNVYVKSKQIATLDASKSIGVQLTYTWSGHPGNPKLSSTTDPTPTFVAPAVPDGSEVQFKYNLTVISYGNQSDSLQVRVVVRRY